LARGSSVFGGLFDSDDLLNVHEEADGIRRGRVFKPEFGYVEDHVPQIVHVSPWVKMLSPTAAAQ
jgi:hypothetical protein